MVGFDERFAEVKKRLAKKQHLEGLMESLQEQYSDLLARVLELREQKEKEQKDVDRLERGSLSSFFLNLAGKKEEKLEKEEKEAYLAAVKCDAAEKELTAVEAQIDSNGKALIELADCETEYEDLLEEKRAAIAEQGLSGLDDIIKAEKKLFALEKEKVEIWEASEAGNQAMVLMEEVLTHLNGAEEWSTFDMFGGGMLSTMMKYDKVDNAQKKIEELQVQLRKFHTELADISVQADIRIEIGEMLRFADYFFDGILADFTAMGRIEEALGQAKATKRRIEEVMVTLQTLEKENTEKQTICKKHLEQLIADAR